MTADERWAALRLELLLERFEPVRRELSRGERKQIADAHRTRDRAIEEHLATRDQPPAAVVPLNPERRRTG